MILCWNTLRGNYFRLDNVSSLWKFLRSHVTLYRGPLIMRSQPCTLTTLMYWWYSVTLDIWSGIQLTSSLVPQYNVIFSVSFPRADSIDRLKAKCGPLEQEIRDPNKFKDFYHFTFNYAKNPGQKGLGEPIVLICSSSVITILNYQYFLHLSNCWMLFLCMITVHPAMAM